jgi:hypothetical protein
LDPTAALCWRFGQLLQLGLSAEMCWLLLGVLNCLKTLISIVFTLGTLPYDH